MPGGWGRRAAGKIDRKLEDDELFKEIGGQLDANNFDYSQWQRAKKTPAKTSRAGRPAEGDKSSDDTPGFTVSSGGGPWGKQAEGGAVCHHGRRGQPQKVKKTIQAAYEEAMERKKAEQIKILQLRIQARKQTIGEYEKREIELLESNMSMREEIDGQEKNAHEEVKKLLRKYEKFRGGISTLNDQFMQELTEARKDLEQAREKVDQDLAALQRQVDSAEGDLKQKQTEFHVLLNYKAKEYPVKSLRISELQKELEQLKIRNKDEATELQHVVETEVEKFNQDHSSQHTAVTQKATEDAIAKMHPSLKDMALQNIVMSKEKEFHTNEITSLEELNKALDLEVKALLRNPKTSVRQQMFPEFFPSKEKCTPDMDVILDIPTQEWLPI